MVKSNGSFAVVHKGTWRDETVALKCVKIPSTFQSDDIAKVKEIDSLRRLNHPNIVSLLAFTRNSEQIVLVMTYVPGTNLDGVIFGKARSIAKLQEAQVVIIALKIALAIEYMHTRNPDVIHQDIKPQNVLVTDDMKGVYVCDMGISKLRVAMQTMTTVSKGPKGTYPYMAPEMFGTGHLGPALDIYSMGCLYIELFWHQRVWPGLENMQIMQKVCGSFNCPPIMPNMGHLKDHYRKVCSLLSVGPQTESDCR